jgi:hypothetical protein
MRALEECKILRDFSHGISQEGTGLGGRTPDKPIAALRIELSGQLVNGKEAQATYV